MKKMTFAVWFTALLAVFTFSSCLDSDNGGQRQGSEIVKVVGMMGTYEFESAAGYKLVPTNMSAITFDINSQFAFISYIYDTEDVDKNPKRIPMQLTGVLPIKEQYTHPSLEGMEDFSNAPITNIATENNSYYSFPITFWNANIMFLPVNYLIKDYADNKDLQKEVESHSFEIYFDIEEQDGSAQDLIFHVRHHVENASLNKERNRANSNIYKVDLSMAIAMFEQKNGEKPERILVKYRTASMDGNVDNNGMETAVEINYRSILDASKK